MHVGNDHFPHRRSPLVSDADGTQMTPLELQRCHFASGRRPMQVEDPFLQGNFALRDDAPDRADRARDD
jgi:hypothetical protein